MVGDHYVFCVDCRTTLGNMFGRFEHNGDIVCTVCYDRRREIASVPMSDVTTRVAKNILEEANALIHGDREKTHGDPGRNLREIAAKWSVTFGTPVTPQQVAIAMIDLKTVRASHDPAHRDHWVDIAGYAGLVDRCGFLRGENAK